ncbi:MAG: aminotransferase class I/II-fold pyridoxal phosphate-dependent enzyme [Clostridiales bacterium]|nr:aminotransferase class I/II-fold pyridoxal phosphate-dependent enzyme [Clostridiales bacterium]
MGGSVDGGRLAQERAPLYEALLRFKADRVVKFDVPGHKGGRWSRDLTDFLGKSCLETDVNSMKPLDNLSHPTSVIRDAERLAADAFGASDAFFMVNGTTGAVQAMIMSACKSGDKIIMPRNVHRSAINALVICGAVPVYVNPGVNGRLGISLGMSAKDVEAAMDEHPDAKAVLVNNPTYYGVCSDMRAIVELAHSRGMLALADEAHGAHFYFARGQGGAARPGAGVGRAGSGAGGALPLPAMWAGADMSAVSMHKTGGSLTQSSFLLCGGGVSSAYVRQVINLTQTTSASYLLMASLDIARRSLALRGGEYVAQAIRLAEYARGEINKLGGYWAFSRELANGGDVFDFDVTKLSVHTRDIGLAGIEVYDMLRDEYGIQIEFGDIGNFLAIVSAGDRELEIERLVSALSEIKRLHSKDKAGMLDHEYISPIVDMPPQRAFYGGQSPVPLRAGAGRVSAEFVMCYPPGIPILAPGERITEDIIQYILYAKAKGCLLMGTLDMALDSIQVVSG